MKTNLLLKTLIIILIASCNNASKTTGKTKNKDEATKQIEQSKTETYTLQKVTDIQNKDKLDYLIYESTEDDYQLTFYTKNTIAYGVLEKYSPEIDMSDYYIFQKQETLHDQLTINLEDALFLKKSNELNPDYSDWTEVDLLLKNYIILQFRGAGYSDYVIIDVTNEKVSNLGMRSQSYEVSADEKFLIGWKDSKTKATIETICPEHKDMIENYVVTEEFKYNLTTGKETLTGKLGCGFVQ